MRRVGTRRGASNFSPTNPVVHVKEITQYTLPAGSSIPLSYQSFAAQGSVYQCSIQGDGSTILSGSYFYFIDEADLGAATVAVWFNVDGASEPPFGYDYTILVSISSGSSTQDVADALAGAMSGFGYGYVAEDGALVTWVANTTGGGGSDGIADVDTGFGFGFQNGYAAHNDPLPASYFNFNDPALGSYYGFFITDGIGSDPAPGGRTGMEIDVGSGDANTAVAAALLSSFQGIAFTGSRVSNVDTITNKTAGVNTDAVDVNVGHGFSILVTRQGS